MTQDEVARSTRSSRTRSRNFLRSDDERRADGRAARRERDRLARHHHRRRGGRRPGRGDARGRRGRPCCRTGRTRPPARCPSWWRARARPATTRGPQIPAPAWREGEADWVAHEDQFDASFLAGERSESDARPWEFSLDTTEVPRGRRGGAPAGAGASRAHAAPGRPTRWPGAPCDSGPAPRCPWPR